MLHLFAKGWVMCRSTGISSTGSTSVQDTHDTKEASTARTRVKKDKQWLVWTDTGASWVQGLDQRSTVQEAAQAVTSPRKKNQWSGTLCSSIWSLWYSTSSSKCLRSLASCSRSWRHNTHSESIHTTLIPPAVWSPCPSTALAFPQNFFRTANPHPCGCSHHPMNYGYW